MRKFPWALAVPIPVLILFAGFAEFYLVYYPYYDYRSQLDTNLRVFFLNLLFGIAVGAVYILFEKQKEGKWGINLRRLFLLLVPLLTVSVFFVLYPFDRVVLTDTMGMPYLNFAEFYYGERLSAHLACFCTGFFLVAVVSKGKAERPSRIFYLCLSAVLIVLIFVAEFLLERLLNHVLGSGFSYYWYESIVLAANLLFGALLSEAVLSRQTAGWLGVRGIGLLLLCLAIGCLPFVFDFVSYQTQFTVPFNRPYYKVLGFFRRADFFQIFQILFGFLIVAWIKGHRKPAIAAYAPS